MKVIQRAEFEKLFRLLKEYGYHVIGPTVRDNAIVFDELRSTSDLPSGIKDENEAGTYRLTKRKDEALFGFNSGPQSWKKYLFPPKLKLWEADKQGKTYEITGQDRNIPKYAFMGVRSCELKAIQVQDKVFNNGMFADPYYDKVRKSTFIIAVNCTEAGGTCFCSSMATGPKASIGYDISLTEVIREEEHYFVVSEGSTRGKELISPLELPEAAEEQLKCANEDVERARNNMGRKLDTRGLIEILQSKLESPHWNDVAARCLGCANCTLVCPTCFCSNVEDITDLTGNHTERWRRWDSCFNLEYSKVAGGNFRTSLKARYRQWLTHKLSTWHDQFDTSGCVGCGRCITWCPAGIDITKEAESIRNN